MWSTVAILEQAAPASAGGPAGERDIFLLERELQARDGRLRDIPRRPHSAGVHSRE